MTRVLVTGASGFIGKNLCTSLTTNPEIELLTFDRSNNNSDLTNLIAKADFIFHLAGINRPKEESEFDQGNRELTEVIINEVRNTKRKIPIILSSSTQAELDNPYGKSKHAAEDALTAWGDESQSPIYIYRLPNVFGKWSKPNYNSVVATFCYNIAHDIDITINDPSTELTLTYIDDVIKEFAGIINGSIQKSADYFYTIPTTFKVTLKDLSERIYAIRNIRKTLQLPDMNDLLNKYLYAAYISFLDDDDYDYSLDTKKDQRGWLAEVIKSPASGQVFVSQTNPGFTRGQHWHHTKIEKFLVVQGTAEISFRKVDGTEKNTYTVTGDELKVIDIPVGYVHSLKNIGTTDLITLIWANEIFDPNKPDTYYSEV